MSDPATTDGEERPHETRRAYYLLFVLLVAYTLNFVDRMIIGVVAEPIKHELKVDDWQIGLLGGLAFAIFYTVLGIPIARLAEKRSRVRIIGWCLIIWSGFTALCGLAQNFGQLVVARIGVGVGEAGCTPAAQSLISDAFKPEKRPMALSIFTLGVPLGTLIGAAVGGWVAEHYGWRHAFMVVGIPGVLLAPVVWATLREPRRGRFDAAEAEPAAAPPSLGDVVAHMWSDRAMRHIVAATTLSAFASYGVQTFSIPFLLRNFDVSLVAAASAYGLVTGAISVAGMLLGGALATRYGARHLRHLATVPGIALVIAAPLSLLAFAQSSLLLLIPLYLCAGLLKAVGTGPSYALVNNLAGPRRRATAIAIMLLFMNLIGLGLGPLFVGVTSDFAAAHFYTGQDYAACAAMAKDAACMAASSHGLRIALLTTSAPLLWAAFHYLAAMRLLGRAKAG